MSTLLKENEKIKRIKFQDGVKTVPISNTNLIMQSILPHTIRPELVVSNKTRVLFWTLFHYNFIPDFLPISVLRKIHLNSKFFKILDSKIKKTLYTNLKKLISKLDKKNSIYFMDNSTFTLTSEFLQINNIKPKIIPICIDKSIKIKTNFNKDNSLIKLCWIGRIEDFKTSILKHSIEQAFLYSLKTKKNIEFSVLGYGNDLDDLISFKKNNDFFKIKFYGKMELDELEQFLMRKVDLLMSMGTSALEGARLGLPTILLDASYFKVPIDYKFKWVYNSDGSNVAQFIESEDYFNEGDSFDEILDALFKNPSSIGYKCRLYVEEHHSPKVVSEKLLSAMERSSFLWEDINRYFLRKNIFRKIYDLIRYKK